MFAKVCKTGFNERPMTALATITVVWSMAFALTFAIGRPGVHAADEVCRRNCDLSLDGKITRLIELN